MRRCNPIVVVERAAPCGCGAEGCEAGHTGYHHTVDVATGERPKPYDIFLHPKILERQRGTLSRHYPAQNRAPITVVLPNGDWFCVDSAYWTEADPNPDKNGWQVLGEFPDITVSPSINCVGRWHGSLINGELSEDVDGRVFP